MQYIFNNLPLSKYLAIISFSIFLACLTNPVRVSSPVLHMQRKCWVKDFIPSHAATTNRL